MLKIYCKEPLFEMAKLTPEESKLHYTIWLDSAGIARNTPHKNTPRVKLTLDNISIPVKVNDTAELAHDKDAKYPHISETLKFITKTSHIIRNHYFPEPRYTDRATLNALTDVANGMSEQEAIEKNIQQ